MATPPNTSWWRRLVVATGLVASAAPAPAQNKPALDVAALWDFSNPALSEQRFRDALPSASPVETVILQTQIARTHGLRRDFSRAREILASLQPQLADAGPEARVRHALESGRSLASATHPAESQTPATRQQARQHFQQALDEARAAQLDGLAIDAIHMFAFIDTDPAQQLHWAEQALAAVAGSKQVAAQRWEPTVRNNLGYALQQLGRLDEAFSQFSQALALRERGGHPAAAHSARFMLARCLRLMGRTDEALAWQQRLHQDALTAGAPDTYVLDELVLLYQQRGEPELAQKWSALALLAKAKATKASP
jgi:tetratricopeptide (TPR) repeat protein